MYYNDDNGYHERERTWQQEERSRQERERTRQSEEKRKRSEEFTKQEQEKTKRAEINSHPKLVIDNDSLQTLTAGVLVIVCMIFLFGMLFFMRMDLNSDEYRVQQELEESEHINNGEVQITKSKSYFKDLSVDDAVLIFETAGFTNIKLDAVKSLVKVGKVKSVSINGDTEFSSNEWFPKDAYVRIEYYVSVFD